MKYFFTPISFILVFLSSVNSVKAIDYYISNSGSDSNPGSKSQPIKTISRLNNQSFLPGDKIYFNRGDSWNEIVKVSNSGNSSASISFSAYGSGGLPTIKALYANNQQYLTFKNLHINSNWENDFAFDLYNTAHIIIRDSDIEGATRANIFAGPTNNLLIERIKSHNSKNEHGIYISGETFPGSHDITIKDSHFFNNGGFGIQLNANGIYIENVSIQRNKIYDNIYGAINDIGSKNSQFTHNLIYNNQNSMIYVSQSSNPNEARSSINNQYYNNTIYSDNPLAWSEVFLVDSQSTEIEFKNNIIDIPNGEIIVVSGGNCTFSNNIYNTNIIFNWKGNFAGNDFANWKQLSGETNSFYTDPLLQDPTTDFTLQPNSPAINTGASLGLSLDLANNTIPSDSSPDIGAYEYQHSSAHTPTPSPTPTPTPTPLPCTGDINQDNRVDFSDYFILVQNFLKTNFDPGSDLDNSGRVDLSDYFLLVQNFLKPCN